MGTRSACVCLLIFTIQVARGQEKNKGFLALCFTNSAIQVRTPFHNTLFVSDSARIETVDSIAPRLWGFEAHFAAPSWIFVVGAQPPSTWLGDRAFRLRYTTLKDNQFITTSDSIVAHFYHASFFAGFGYRLSIPNRHFDIALIPYWEKQTGRFIIHDSLYTVYNQQAKLSTEQRNALPDAVEVDLNELSQERTRNFAIGLRVNFSLGITATKGYGLIFFFTPRAQYSYLTKTDHLYSTHTSSAQGGWSYGGTVGIGMLLGHMAPQKRKPKSAP